MWQELATLLLALCAQRCASAKQSHLVSLYIWYVVDACDAAAVEHVSCHDEIMQDR